MRKVAPLRVAIMVAWSILVWTALWFEVTVANVLWGAVVGLVLLTVIRPPRPSHRLRIRPLALLRYAVYFAWALVRASAVVAWEIITPGNQINEGIVAAPLRTRSPGVITLIANSISLTPGTLTLEIREEPPTLYIHILHLRTIDEVREDIRQLEDLALRAFPTVPEEAS